MRIYIPTGCKKQLTKLCGDIVVRTRDLIKFIGISIIACCAAFVCTLFLNYNIDLAGLKEFILTDAGIAIYNAQVLVGKVIAAVTGGALIIASVIMLVFLLKNYIDAHGKELGILKALGYSNIHIAKSFWVFGCSVFAGCTLGFILAFIYMPMFYKIQNTEGILPDLTVKFHFSLVLLIVLAPTALFSILSVLYACFKLNSPVLDLLREKSEVKVKIQKKVTPDLPFLQDLKVTTLKSKKSLVFFVAFSAFCFSDMVQTSMSMQELASAAFAIMVIGIGLILAFVTLFLSLSCVVKGNTKTIAMMRIFGYEYNSCCHAIFDGYRPFAYIGFAIGTIYQYGLLEIVVSIVFADVKNVPEYTFDIPAFVFTLVAFAIIYELAIRYFSLQIKKLSIKSVMLE